MAQELSPAAQWSVATIVQQDRPAAPRDRLAATLSIDLGDVSLQMALDEIMRQSGTSIVYSKAVVPVTKRVSVRGKGITVKAALEQALAGTQTEVRVTQSGDVFLARGDAGKSGAQQTEGVIIGKVIHAKTKQPIAGATVVVDGVTPGVKTGEDGAFRIQVETGSRSVSVRALGFVRQVKRVDVSGDTDVTVEVVLEPSASVLDEVVVTGTVVATERKAIPTPITVITAEEIERRGITRLDQFFRGEVPGVTSIDPGSGQWVISTGGVEGQLGQMASSKVYARGGSSLDGGRASNPLKIYVDGVELMNSDYLGTVDPQSIERVEIITGPQAATIYGSGAMGGVMQVFTKKGRGGADPDVTLNLRYGAVQSSFSSAYTPRHNHAIGVTGGVGPEFSYSGNLSYTYLGQWQPGLYARTIGASAGVTHRRGGLVVNGAVSVSLSENGTSGYQNSFNDGYGSILQRDLIESGEWSQANTAAFFTRRISKSNGQTVSLNMDYTMHPRWSHRVTLGRSQTGFDMVPEQPVFASASDTLLRLASSAGKRTTWGYNTTVSTPPWEYLTSTMTLGVNGSIGDQLSVNGCFNTTVDTRYASCGSLAPTVSRPLNTKSWGGFGSWQIGFFDHLYLTLGLRAEKNPDYGRRHKIDWTPTNGVTYTHEFGDLTMKLLGSYGRATRAPVASYRLARTSISSSREPALMVSQLESPYLTPEYSRGPQGGVELYWGNRGSLAINRFYQKTTDLIQRVKVDSAPYVRLSDGENMWLGIYQYLNTATIRQHGWDGTISFTLSAFSVKGTYSWTDSRVVSINENAGGFYTWASYGNTNILTDIPTHTGNLTLGYARGATSISLVMNYMGSFIRTQAIVAVNYNCSARLKMYGDVYQCLRSETVSSIATPPYAKSDLAISHRVNEWATLIVNVDNVRNSHQSDWGEYYPSLGRQSLFGVSIKNPFRR